MAANSRDTQAWKFRAGDGRIDILPDLARRTLAVDPDDHHLFASLGCAAENLSIAAAARGLPGEVPFDAGGGSAGALSAVQMAIRHPDRVSALILLVPLAYKPPTEANSAAPMAPWVENLMMTAIGSDFLFWSGLQVARAPLIGTVLATPPALLDAASPEEPARLDLA